MTEILGNKLLQGELTYLDAIQKADLPHFARWFSDVEVLRNAWAQTIMPQTVESEEIRYERMRNGNDISFTIRRLSDNVLLGNCSLKSPDWRSRWSEVGIVIGDREQWGKGYGTDAMQILLRYGFLELNLHRIELNTASYNPRGIRSYEKSGFKTEVILRQAIYRDGTYHDKLTMAILRDEWEAGEKGGKQ